MLIGFDTETILKNHVHELYSLQLYNKTEGVEVFENERGKILNSLALLEEDSTLIAHNAEFDCAVLKHAFPDDVSIEALYNKGRFISAELKVGDKKFKILDNMNYFPRMKLEKVGKIMGFKKLKKPRYLGIREPKAGKEMSYFKRYAMRDSEICLEVGKFLEENYGRLRSTLPAISFNLIRTSFNKKGLFMDFGKSLEAKIREAYHGGRVESFARGTPKRKTRRYDKRSLYPMIMHDCYFPDCVNGFFKRTDIDLDKYGIAKVKVKTDDVIGFLGIKRVCKDGLERLIFPKGIFEGWFTIAELKYFHENNLGEILKVKESWECDEAQKYFKPFVNTFFELRSENPEMSDFYKLFMNSPYGKFAQDCTLTKVEYRDNFCGKRKDISLKPAPRNLLIAAYITANARIYMNGLFRKIGYERLYYTDTDSIHSSKKITHKSFINESLNGFKIEDEGKATYVRSKFYLFNDSLCCRGLSKIITAPVMRKMIEADKVEQAIDILIRPRSAMRRHLFLSEVKEMKKVFSTFPDPKRKYDREIKTPDLLTDFTMSEPLTLGK